MINYCVRQQRWSTSYQCKRCFMTASYLSWLLIKPCCCSCSCPTKLFSEGRMHCMDQSWRQSRRWSIAGLFNSIRLNDGWLIRNWEFSSHLNCFKYLSPRHERHKKFQWWCPCEVWPKTGKGGLNWCTTTQLPNVYPGVCVCVRRARWRIIQDGTVALSILIRFLAGPRLLQNFFLLNLKTWKEGRQIYSLIN